jgi:low affinity Fe/Cu permease
MFRQFARALTYIGVIAAHPAAFCIVFVYIACWLIFSPGSFDWNAGASIATWLMTFFIQRAGHRDTQAIHAKLDELLRVEESARPELIRIDEQEPEEIEQHRLKERDASG